MTNSRMHLWNDCLDELIKILDKKPSKVTFYAEGLDDDGNDVERSVVIDLLPDVKLNNKIASMDMKISLLEKEAAESKKKDERIAELEKQLKAQQQLLFMGRTEV